MTEPEQQFGEFKPTPELRFVLRSIPAPELGENLARGARILQQKWEAGAVAWQGARPVKAEWRDVPLTDENGGPVL